MKFDPISLRLALCVDAFSRIVIDSFFHKNTNYVIFVANRVQTKSLWWVYHDPYRQKHDIVYLNDRRAEP